MRRRCLIGALAGLALAVPAAAQRVTAADPDTILKAVQAEGYGATLGTDTDGDPIVRMNLEGAPSVILFYGCKAGKACRTIGFRMAYNIKGQWPMAAVNACNAENRWIRCWADAEGDPTAQMDVNLVDGTSAANFSSVFQTWLAIKREFEKTIGWPASGS